MQNAVSKKLDATIEFVKQKRRENSLTDEDVSLVMVGAGFTGDDPTPAESIAINARIIKAINKLHPELIGETLKLGQDRLR